MVWLALGACGGGGGIGVDRCASPDAVVADNTTATTAILETTLFIARFPKLFTKHPQPLRDRRHAAISISWKAYGGGFGDDNIRAGEESVAAPDFAQQSETRRDDQDAGNQTRSGTPVSAAYVAIQAAEHGADGKHDKGKEAAEGKHREYSPVSAPRGDILQSAEEMTNPGLQQTPFASARTDRTCCPSRVIVSLLSKPRVLRELHNKDRCNKL